MVVRRAAETDRPPHRGEPAPAGAHRGVIAGLGETGLVAARSPAIPIC
ncbi:hypothetical protein ACL03H_16050 [Saccharopolyspora sp. MS10]